MKRIDNLSAYVDVNPDPYQLRTEEQEIAEALDRLLNKTTSTITLIWKPVPACKPTSSSEWQIIPFYSWSGIEVPDGSQRDNVCLIGYVPCWIGDARGARLKKAIRNPIWRSKSRCLLNQRLLLGCNGRYDRPTGEIREYYGDLILLRSHEIVMSELASLAMKEPEVSPFIQSDPEDPYAHFLSIIRQGRSLTSEKNDSA